MPDDIVKDEKPVEAEEKSYRVYIDFSKTVDVKASNEEEAIGEAFKQVSESDFNSKNVTVKQL